MIATALSGCEVQRAQEAADAKTRMLGMTKQQVLSCMGAPAQKATEGKTEVWSYASGNGHTEEDASATYSGGVVGAISGQSVTTRRYCVVNVVLDDGRVRRVTYSGPTGGLLTDGEQCGFAVRNCLR